MQGDKLTPHKLDTSCDFRSENDLK